ncbi:putative Zinc finger, C3HC4 type (RING finger) containing protein [Leishmania shawi]|uniref:Zinc finger, C3HC4 type (RING finger) containing protein n=1 Tax=Leishmania shawi TaxID=5680 RepID=A0AAW3BGP1_9TRYP
MSGRRNRNQAEGGGGCCNAAGGLSSDDKEVPVECLICADPCRALCVFQCGHYTCYSCGLRIHSVNKGSCPVCRKEATEMPIITQKVSREEEQFSAEEVASMRRVVTTDHYLRCVIDSPQLACEMAKLYEYTCPIESCWCQGYQDPFLKINVLKDHLWVDHELVYCEVCLQHRPAFLCEQVAYSSTALQHHMEGRCRRDRSSFTGHPPCRFCKRTNRFYDGESLLKHMQQQHYTCDVCNRGQFTFTFYASRQKLDQHFHMCHKICDHPDCSSLDLMMRVFGNEIDLMVHKQRVHGVKAKVTFSPAMFGEASGAPAGSGSTGTAPATASNANVIQITFDHIFRVETVAMMPTKENCHGGGRHGGGGGGGQRSVDTVHAPEENGIPLYYLHSDTLPILTRPVASDVGTASISARSGGAWRNDTRSDPSFSAFAIAEDMRNYNVRNKLPTDRKQIEQRLNDMLSKHLRSPVAYAQFRSYTRDFMESAMLTSKYYDVLARECFPNPQVFHGVFPLIVATVPVAAKQAALQEVHKMRMAPEMQRIARAREEDARKEAEARTAAASAEEVRNCKAEKNNSNTNGGNKKSAPAGAPSPFGRKNAKGEGGRQNAWLTTDTRSKFGVSSSAPAQHQDPFLNAHATSPTTLAPSAAASLKSNSNSGPRAWGSATVTSLGPSSITPAAASAPVSTAVHVGGGLVINEETFPSLPNNGIRRDPISKAQRAKPNAWFKR